MAFSGGSSTGGFGNGINVTATLHGAREFNRGTESLSAGVSRMGRTVRGAKTEAIAAEGGFTRFGRGIGMAGKSATGGIFSFKGLTRAIAGFTGAFVGYQAVRNAITANEQLVTSSENLRSAFGLTTRDALTWAATTKILGIGPRSINMGFIQLSRNLTQAREGSENAIRAFNTLGISSDSLERRGHDLDGTMRLVIRSLGKIDNPATRAAVGQQLLGRGFQSLLPLMTDNARVWDRLSGTLDNFFKGHHLEDSKKFRLAMIDYRTSVLELQIAFAEELEPTLIKGATALRKFIDEGQRGKGVAGALLEVYHGLGVILGTVYGFLSKHKEITKLLTYTVLGLWAAVKLYNISMAVWVAGNGLARGVLMGMRLIRWEFAALTVAMEANPAIALATAFAVLAIGAGILGYKLGMLINEHGGLKAVAGGAIDWVRHKWNQFIGFFASIPGRIKGAISGLASIIIHPFKVSLDWIENKWHKLPGPLRHFISDPSGAISGLGSGVHIPGLAMGGEVYHGAGAWVTGERGPELNSFTGSKVRVQPLTSGAQVKPVNWQNVGEQVGDSRDITIRVPIHIDRRQIGEAMTSYISDKRARR